MEKRTQMSNLYREVLQQNASLLEDRLTLGFVEKFSKSHKKLLGNRDLSAVAGDGDERAVVADFLTKLVKSDDVNFATFLKDLDSCGLSEVKDELEKTLMKMEEYRSTSTSRTGKHADVNRPNMDVRDIIQHLASAVEDLTARVSVLQGGKGGNSSHGDHHDEDVIHALEIALVKKEEEVELYKELLEKERAERLRGEEEIGRLITALDLAKAEIAELRKIIGKQGRGIRKQEKEIKGLHTQTDRLVRDVHSMQKQMKEISVQALAACTPVPEDPSPVSPPPTKPVKLPPMADKPADPNMYVQKKSYQPVLTRTPRAGERKVEETLKDFNQLKKKTEVPKDKAKKQ